MSAVRVFLIGNPNCGKTSLFNAITGERRHVGNWPGVTVERIEGRRLIGDTELIITDLPGTYSLTPASPEERIAVEELDEAAGGVILNIIDAGNLERNLFLTFQLLELGLRPWLVFNCYDTLLKSGIKLDLKKVSQLTGCPAFATVARSGEGIEELCKALAQCKKAENVIENSAVMRLPPPWQEAVEQIMQLTTGCNWENASPTARLAALQLLSTNQTDDDSLQSWRTKLLEIKERLMETMEKADKASSEINDLQCGLAVNRYDRISRFLKACCKPIRQIAQKPRDVLTERLDAIFTDKFWGLPIFLLLTAAMFWTTFTLGALPGEAIESIVSYLKDFLSTLMAPNLFRDLLLDGILTGIGGILVFLPNVLILFLWISFLEDSGYMARAAFLTDRLMQMVGLHGKAFAPLLMGFGCNVPAIMALRVLEDRRQRMLAALLIPMLGCSARLPVLVLFCGVFFPNHPGLILALLYAIDAAIVFLLGYLLAKLIPALAQTPFLLELPPYRLPTLRSMGLMVWDKTKHFIEKAGGVILAGTVLIWALTAFPRDVQLSRPYASEIEVLEKSPQNPQLLESKALLKAAMAEEIMEKRYIGIIGRLLEPLVAPLGFGWREAVSLIPGFLAKESIVSTLSVLYSPIDKNLGNAMKHEGKTAKSAFLFMLFTMLYVPCLPTVAMILHETGSKAFTLAATFLPGASAWLLTYGVSLLIGAGDTTAGKGTLLICLFFVMALWYIIRKLQRLLAGASTCEACNKASCSVIRNELKK